MPRGIKEAVASGLVVKADDIARFKAGTIAITIPAITLTTLKATAEATVTGLLTTDYIIVGLNTTNTALTAHPTGAECRTAGKLEVAFASNGTLAVTASPGATLNYIRIVA